MFWQTLVFVWLVMTRSRAGYRCATLMDLKKATTLASVTVMAFMLSGGFFVQKIPVFVSWIRYLSFNYHTYKLLLKIQYGDAAERIDRGITGSGLRKVTALVIMVVRYRLLAYVSLRRMRSGS